MATKDASRLIPLWIYMFSALLFLSSLVGVYGGYVDPGILLSEFSEANWMEPHARMLAGYWGSKNLAFCIVFVAAFLARRVAWLVPLFAFRFISDGVDMLVMTPLYREAGPVEVILPFFVLGLPSLFAALYVSARVAPQGPDHEPHS